MADQAGAAEDEIRPQLWPSSLPFMHQLVKYEPAKFTQEIAVTDGSDRISKVHRTWIDNQHKWGQPGGMHNIKGWKSDLYKFMPIGEPKTWVGNIPVSFIHEGQKKFQYNRGWKRSYDDGTVFADVLSNAETGKPFEVRFAEKKGNKWERYTAFKDLAQRPSGYHGLKMKCSVCHNSTDGPGTGGYAVGLVLGGDTVVSDPIPALER